MKKSHAPNCDCYDCNPGDAYISHLKNNYGKNAVSGGNMLPARVGVYGMADLGFNNYSSHFLDMNHADAPTGIVPAPKADIKAIFGDALGGILGNIIQKKKDGETLPKALDVVATLGIKTEQAAVTAAQKAAEKELGAKVLKFSPAIIIGIVSVLALVAYLMFKK